MEVHQAEPPADPELALLTVRDRGNAADPLGGARQAGGEYLVFDGIVDREAVGGAEPQPARRVLVNGGDPGPPLGPPIPDRPEPAPIQPDESRLGADPDAAVRSDLHRIDVSGKTLLPAEAAPRPVGIPVQRYPRRQQEATIGPESQRARQLAQPIRNGQLLGHGVAHYAQQLPGQGRRPDPAGGRLRQRQDLVRR